MIIWSGWGFLVAVITFGFCLLVNLAVDAQFGEGYYSEHNWAIGSALMAGGIASAIVGFALLADEGEPAEEGVERVPVNAWNDTFFFIPMHWAGIVITIIGICLAASDAFNAP
jgi:hypothetical protein